MELSNELKVERIRLSLTAKSVAEEMGISRQQLCNIEQSETAPRGGEIHRFSKEQRGGSERSV